MANRVLVSLASRSLTLPFALTFLTPYALPRPNGLSCPVNTTAYFLLSPLPLPFLLSG